MWVIGMFTDDQVSDIVKSVNAIQSKISGPFLIPYSTPQIIYI